jgi:hypothetical protein
MSDERKRARFWIAVALMVAVLVGYPLSAGPATWLEAKGTRDKIPNVIDSAVFYFYAPLRWYVKNGPRPVGRALEWYINLWR